MRIGFLSTYPPQHCGIGTYAEKLTLAIARESGEPVTVLCEEGGETLHDKVPVEAVFSRKGDYSDKVVEAARRHSLDVLHIQHAPDIFGMGGKLVKLLQALRSNGIASVVTLHTVYTAMTGLMERKPNAVGFHRSLGLNTDILVAHQHSMGETLIKHGVSSGQIVEIPHGTTLRDRGDGTMLRERFGFPEDSPVLLAFGFIHMQKNVHVLIPMMAHLRDRLPEARLLVAGKIAGNLWYNRAYFRYMQFLIRRHRMADRVVLHAEFVPGKEIDEYYDLAAVALHPYLQGYGSASGAAHSALSAGCPLLCSDIAKFDDIGRHVSTELLVPARAPAAWADAVHRLLTDEVFARRVLVAQETYAKKSSWPEVARAHLTVYRKATGRR